MNLLSERDRAASYMPLEYRDAGEPFPFNDEQFVESSSEQVEQPPLAPVAEQQPDPATLFAARVEEERRTITAQVRQESERDNQRVRAEIARAIESFAQQRDEYFRQAESEIVNLALAIARRLIHRETQIDPRLLAGLVNYELEQLDAATSVRLFVSPDSLKYWNDAVLAMSRPVEVALDKALAPGAARIETILGSTIVSFERELKEIECGFFDLLSHRPVTADAERGRATAEAGLGRVQ